MISRFKILLFLTILKAQTAMGFMFFYDNNIHLPKLHIMHEEELLYTGLGISYSAHLAKVAVPMAISLAGTSYTTYIVYFDDRSHLKETKRLLSETLNEFRATGIESPLLKYYRDEIMEQFSEFSTDDALNIIEKVSMKE